MAHEEERTTLIYEARVEKIVSPKGGKSTVRIARFLKPLAKNVNEAVVIPNTPLLSEIFSHNLQQWPSKVLFRGWKLPQKKWKEWVDRLAEKYGIIWNQAGICDAIMSSIYEVRCNQELVLGLSEFWCPETNTFMFPWGEATITLEDVMILGGFPVLGEPVTSSPLTVEFIKIEEEMNKQRMEMSRSKARKAGHPGWLKHFMEEEGEFEHVAFLSLWLSRYVFPSFAEETIGKHVFPIAARLSQGIQVALAPAVLASLYKDLRFLREQAISSSGSIIVSAPFQLVQLWAFERFPLTGPNSPNSLEPGEPRVALWHKLNSKINVPLVRSALRLQENFKWRPYAINLKNWRHTSYYKESQQLVFDNSSLDDELRSFLRCLQASELVGIGCKEKYLPQRVAMQFGMDQDLAGDNSGFNLISENTKFFVPPRSFEPGVSLRYFSWWKKSMSARRDAVNDVLVQKGIVKKSKTSPSVQAKINEEDCQASVESRSLKKPCTISQASTKSDGKGSPASLENSVIRANGASRAAIKPTLSASAHAKNCEDGSHAADSSRTLKSPQKLSQRNVFLPLVELSMKTVENQLSKPEENPQGKATIRSTNGVAKEMERKVDSGNGPNEVYRELKRMAFDVFVQKGIVKKSKTSPSVKAKINEEDCQASVESGSLKRPCTPSQASTKSVGKGSLALVVPDLSSKIKMEIIRDWSDEYHSLENSVLRAGGASRTTMKPKMSASVQAKNCEDDSHAAVSSRTLKSPKKLSSKSNIEEGHASVTHEFSSKITYQDSSDDGIVPAKHVSPTCGTVNENCRKRKSVSKTEENPQGKATIRSTNRVAKEGERKVDSGNGPNEVSRRAKRMASDSANDPLDSVSLSEWIKLRKGGTEPVKDVEEERKEAGGSFNNPIDVDCCIETFKRRSQKLWTRSRREGSEARGTVGENLGKAHKDCRPRNAPYTTHYAWMDHFMESGGRFEHEAFLALWLSRYIFPRKDDTVGRNGECEGDGFTVTLWAPFQLVQLWAWERFPSLRPNPNFIRCGEPISARWQRLKKLKVENVGMALDSAMECFQWRPYAILVVNNWMISKFYRENEDWVLVDSDMDKELESFARCLRVCELVGLDCIEQYLPHRVAMQFGMDQDLPGYVTRCNETPEIAWRNYNRPITDAKIYMPPRLFESDVTTRYSKWWRQWMLAREDGIRGIVRQQRSKTCKRLPWVFGGKEENSHALFPHFPSKHIEVEVEEDKLTIAEMLRLDNKCNSFGDRPAGDNKPLPDTSCQISSPSAADSANARNMVSLMKPVDISMQHQTLMGRPMRDMEDVHGSKLWSLSVSMNNSEGESCSHCVLKIPGLELEARINKLEKLVAGLKAAKFGYRIEEKSSKEDLTDS
ncbi:hypothetical protein F0562_008807 [Nyssa sinensis]|uniref:Aminotransferase-like plant mobile domain-containing protein n=1 Tax=Nyssa sinensis TaxID=561372 RepID=A0A5J5A9R9_9ASTE|nr:hypothetical protein F0562_008807 [Nyssa sinensis]